jgi:hypothetical protein
LDQDLFVLYGPRTDMAAQAACVPFVVLDDDEVNEFVREKPVEFACVSPRFTEG